MKSMMSPYISIRKMMRQLQVANTCHVAVNYLLALNQEWSKHDILKNIDDITLHYLDGHINVEACLPLKYLQHIEDARYSKTGL